MGSISRLFATPALAQVLSLFLLNSEKEFYQLEVAKKTKKALMQVQRTLKTLEEIGLISSLVRGRMIYYKAVKTHPAFKNLKELFVKTIGLGDLIYQTLLPYQDKISMAFIFGSIASGKETADSDIDLFIVSDLSLKELSKALSPLSKDLDRELNPVVFRYTEYQKKISEKDHFLLEVINSPKLWVIGNETNITELGKRRKTKNS